MLVCAVLLPSLMVWAWESPADLRSLDARRAGVAYLAGTLELRPGEVKAKPRLQPLKVAPGAAVVAVVRLESVGGALGDRERLEAVRRILALTARAHPAGVQVDFDARLSERAFYRRLLADLRAQLPRGELLSMTALPSWCAEGWLDALPVDEIVPMLYSHRLARIPPGSACEAAAGVLFGQSPPARARRVYVFPSGRWTEQRLAAVLR